MVTAALRAKPARPVPRRHQIPTHVVAGPHQVPGRFLLDAGHGDRDDLPQMQQPGQMPGIAQVGLDPIPGRALQLRRRRDLAVDALPGQEPGQPEPGRPGLIGDRDRARQRPDPARRSRRDPGSTAARTAPRSAHPAHTPPPNVRAHPARHSYDSPITGASHICGSTGQDPLLPGNPRSHVARPQPGPPYRLAAPTRSDGGRR